MSPPPPPGPADADQGGTTDSLSPGSTLAERYEIQRRLGTGGMGTVYLARHREMDRLCAVKVLHPRLSQDAEARARFAQEARNASRINHPNVCTVYDYGTSPEGLVYLVMEYVEGRTLGSILTERGTLALHHAARLTAQMAAGLDAAHALGIVHRDLKPDNVIIAKTRDGETAKLVDFGIAKALETGSVQSLTSDGVVVGTPEYMSPEAFSGDPVDQRSDIYSLAMVFYRMVTGAVAHRGKSARETLSRRLVEPAEPLGRATGGGRYPQALESALARGLARQPTARPETSGELAREISEAVATVPPDSEEHELTVRLDAPTTEISRTLPETVALTRRRTVMTILGVVFVALAAFLGKGFLRPSSQGSEPSTTEPIAITPPTGGVTPPPAPASPASPSGVDQPVQGTSAPRDGRPLNEAVLLPTAEEIEDSNSRGDARGRAEQIYGQPDRDPVERSRGAFLVAMAHLGDQDYRLARHWANLAVVLNDSTPAGPGRVDRGQRYRNLLATISKLEEPNLP